ncbi:WD domain, G-beta repeat-containing protein [Besnoitia besnoiti]|uniref:WD domain, G-beta repeat-containing protein n=1 Tax=Besnoitia besnoiti TaxID=94643 RepID=A0A2A9MJD7_BESBE|nr:WD domain, G-beta repeat-containing protein [Besnoitia besnoiti]PFH38658.1 WD domain, G-beta repeat-containing protein [Besnoitia besnoiti]
MPRVSLPQVLWHSKDDKHSDRVYSVDLQPFLSVAALASHPSFSTRAAAFAASSAEPATGSPLAPQSSEVERARDRDAEREVDRDRPAGLSRREERAREKRAATLAAYSRLATAGADEFVHLWRWSFEGAPSLASRSGLQISCVARLLGHEREVNCVRWSPDGVFLASGGYDNATCIWELGQKPETVPLGYDSSMLDYDEWWARVSLYRCIEAVNSLAWSPSGRQLAIGTEDGRLIVVDVQNGVMASKSARVLEGHSNMVQGVAWDPLDTFLVSQSSDQSVRLWGRRAVSGGPAAGGAGAGPGASGAVGGAASGSTTAVAASGGAKGQWKIEAVLRNARDRGLREKDGSGGTKDDEEDDPEALLNNLNASPSPSSSSGAATSPALASAPSSAAPASSGERLRQQGRSLFYPESLIRSFFRRPDWSPDGSILVTPAGLQYLLDAAAPAAAAPGASLEPCHTTYVFHRKLLTFGTPFVTHRSSAGPSLAVRFNPVAYQPLPCPAAPAPASAPGGQAAAAEGGDAGCRPPPPEVRVPKSWLFSPSLDAAHRLEVLAPGGQTDEEGKRKRQADNADEQGPPRKSPRDEGDAKAPEEAAEADADASASPAAPATTEAEAPASAAEAAVFPRFVYAVCTLHGSVLIYDTQFMAGPLAQLHGLHLAPMTDATWSSDGRVLVASSSDGYLTFVFFDVDELGKPLRPAGFFYRKLRAPALQPAGRASAAAPGASWREDGEGAAGGAKAEAAAGLPDALGAGRERDSPRKGLETPSGAGTAAAPRRLGVVGNAAGKRLLVVGNAAAAVLRQKEEA